MKKEKSPILVVLCIFVLLLFIVLPPVFRSFVPRTGENESSSLNQQNKISILQCSKINAGELYQVNVRMKYMNSVIESNIITYKKLESLPEDYQEVEIVTSIIEEYQYLSALSGIEKQAEEPNPILVITQDTINQNEEDDNLKLYFQDDITSQRTFYEQNGYSCNINEA